MGKLERMLEAALDAEGAAHRASTSASKDARKIASELASELDSELARKPSSELASKKARTLASEQPRRSLAVAFGDEEGKQTGVQMNFRVPAEYEARFMRLFKASKAKSKTTVFKKMLDEWLASYGY